MTTRQEIYTDEKGHPLARPAREDFSDVVEYIRAVHAYNDRISDLANGVFDRVFRSAL